MLTNWKLSNFKAINEEQQINLSPITVLAGANSSGKSSVLQSILLVSQTLRAKPGEQPVLLNGEYVRLGYISDILHDGNANKPFVFGFGVALNRDNTLSTDETTSTTGVTQIEVSVGVEDKNNEQSRAILKSVNIMVENEKALGLVELQDKFDLSQPMFESILIPGEVRDDLHKNIYSYKINFSSYHYHKIDTFHSQISLKHFLPSRVLETYDAGMEMVGKNFEFLIAELKLTEEQRRRGKLSRSQQATAQFDGVIGKLLIKHLREGLTTSSQLKQYKDNELSSQYTVAKNRAIGFLKTVDNLEAWLDVVFLQIVSSYRVQMAQELLIYSSRLAHRQNNLRNEEIGVRSVPIDAKTRASLDQVIDFFSNRIYYLGPLRESPQFIYNLPPYPEVTHVGLKGEFTASVLEHFKGTKVQYPLPFRGKSREPQIDIAPLAYALQVWLEHMGLLESVSTTDRGKMGTELSVHAQGVGRALDLTSIGVGVSQVLPTLVMGLIAPKGTTFLLEQPELHLHPKVQSILADFLLGLTWIGKQCIVETHSEYLINRLRRRVAEDEKDSLANKISIYFVEREKGESYFHKVNVNEFGAVIKWPKGFFDEGPAESQLIMAAAMEKRRRSKLDSANKKEGL